MVAMPAHRPLPFDTYASLMQTQTACLQNGIACDIQVQYGSSIVQSARNKSAATFLDSKFTHLFWIDSDMKWEPQSFVRLLAMATKMECVGASYPMRQDPIRFCVSIDTDLASGLKSNEWGCLPIKGFGLGFTCVQRKVMEQLAERAPKIVLPDIQSTVASEIFRTEIVPTDRAKELGATGEFRGEDMCFFADVAKLGYTVWLDPTIRLGHIGEKVYEGAFADMLVLT